MENIQTEIKLNEQKQDVFNRLRKLIMNKLYCEEHEVTIEASLKRDLGADSLDCIEFVMDCEEEFNIEIPDSEVESYLEPSFKVKNIQNLICTHLKISKN
jgi:acyl carrier protein